MEYTKEPEFEDNLIHEKGEMLTLLYEKMNLVRNIQSVKAGEKAIVESSYGLFLMRECVGRTGIERIGGCQMIDKRKIV